MLRCGQKILVHKAPIYNTTATSFEMLGLVPVEADFNDLDDIRNVLEADTEIAGALVQYTRQKMDDRYDMHEVIRTIKDVRDIPVLTDDNYAVMKVKDIGIQCGADLSCFSSFKLLGPEGIGIVVGKKKYVDKLVELAIPAECRHKGMRRLTYCTDLSMHRSHWQFRHRSMRNV